jgi:cytochrome b subunit of formate dehydrogenase
MKGNARKAWPLIGILLCAASSGVFAQENQDCLKCHKDPALSKTGPDGAPLSLYVDELIFKGSVHGSDQCVSCHSDVESLPHPKGLKPVNCGNCHDEAEAYKKSAHGLSLEKGDTGAASCDNCHGKHDIRHTADPLSSVYPKNLPATCGKCHSDPALVKSHMISVMNPSVSYLKSIHSQTILSGNLKAATCTKCHGTHDLLRSDDPNSKVYRKNIPTTCGTCHPKPLQDYLGGIHGKAMEHGIKDAPTCIDCHGEHDIEAPSSPTSKVNKHQVVKQTCVRCHDNERIMYKYGIETGRQASYMDSYHGMASEAGSDIVASCASCHGEHRILPSSDPASSVNKSNLPQTCGKCHENASPSFAVGAVHIMPTDPGQKALGIVRIIYMLLITGIIGGMIVHNTLVMGRRAAIKFKQELGGAGTYRRFTTAMTIGHLVLTVAFIALALSGFALRYPDTWWARLIFHGETGLAARGIVHRIAALVLVGLAICNGSFLVFTKAGRKELGYLMMKFRDAKDVVHNLCYVVGIAKHPPLFDRYSYIEKFEYWGMWWGTILMIFTGFCMWFVNLFLKFLPKIALDVVALVHFYEAWLAVLTIVVWHLYYMIFDPQTYPMNWSWITGHITIEDLKERHPLEFEREVGEEGQAGTDEHGL